jgi:hypothetical protein
MGEGKKGEREDGGREERNDDGKKNFGELY